MKYIVLIVATLAACSAKVIDPNAGYQEGDRYIFFPDGEGALHLVDLQDDIDYAYLNQLASRSADANQYWLYTRNNPTNPQFLLNGNSQTVSNSNFNPSWPVVVVAHGWNNQGNSDVNNLIRDAFLQRGDYNVIVVDWSALANRNYVTAKNGVPDVGKGVGVFLDFLTTAGASYDRMHLVGHSLGAHLVANAADAAAGEVSRVTGLDPAGPLWGSDARRIQAHHARYVEVMHTSTMLGLNSILGDVDFWPNGGTSMPGCWVSTCSHGRAYLYFAASVKYNHLFGNQCDSQSDAERDRCTGPLFEMGNGDHDKNGSGLYRVNTGRNYPY